MGNIFSSDQNYTVMAAPPPAEPPEPSEIEKRIIGAFEVFDHTHSKVVDVREVGAIVRFLGCCPNESELQEIIALVEDKETTGSVQQERFVKIMKQILEENRLQPASAEELLKAFLTLDNENQGYVTKEFLSSAMMEDGEPFTQEELDEMMAVAVDTETGNIPYEIYINKLMISDADDSAYQLAVKQSQMKPSDKKRS